MLSLVCRGLSAPTLLAVARFALCLRRNSELLNWNDMANPRFQIYHFLFASPGVCALTESILWANTRPIQLEVPLSMPADGRILDPPFRSPVHLVLRVPRTVVVI